jgi:SAM-dependent methyltransferase
MKFDAEQDRWILKRFLDSLSSHGPLGTAKRVNTAMARYFRRIHWYQRLFLSIDAWLLNLHNYLDGAFDREFGTDTSGYIPLDRLTIESGDVREGVWYEPMSAKIFAQIMNNIGINYEEFEFVDFGSGKGRVLLLASQYEFKRIVGVEFSKELHQIATKNIALRGRGAGKQSNISTCCADATEYAIPDARFVAFFYSPFMGKTMERVLENISASFRMNPREIVLVFYGENADTIGLLKKMNFSEKELKIRSDWAQFTKYRAFIFRSAARRGEHMMAGESGGAGREGEPPSMFSRQHSSENRIGEVAAAARSIRIWGRSSRPARSTRCRTRRTR